MAVALTIAKPFETRLPERRSIWLQLAFDPVEVELEKNNTLHKYLIAKDSVTVSLSGAYSAAFVKTTVKCLHVFLRNEVFADVALQVYGRSSSSLDILPTLGQGDAVLGQLLLTAAHLVREPHSGYRSDYLARAIAAQLLGHHTQVRGQAPSPAVLEPLTKSQMRRIHEFLENNLVTNFLFVDLANAAGLSRTAFFARFVRTMNMTPHQYLQRLRVDKAKEMLTETNMSLAEIASVSGFSDQSHLTRLFKRHIGTTPARFRGKLE